MQVVWAVAAVIAFILALAFHLAGHGVARYVLDAELIGLIFLAVHLALWGRYPWHRSQ